MPAIAHQSKERSTLISICDKAIEYILYLTMFLIPVFFIIYTRDQFELPKLTIFRMLTAVMLGFWGCRIIAAGQWAFRRTPLDIPILIWSAYQVFTTVVSVSSHVSFMGEYENFRGLLTVLNYTILYFIITNFVRTRAQINKLLFTVLLSGLIVTFYGIAQFFGIDFIRWNPNSIAPGRYFSTLGNPNFLAAFLSMVMPLAIIFFVETKSAFRRGLLLISFISMFWALMGTNSRGGLLGLITAIAVLCFFVLFKSFQTIKSNAEAEGLTFNTLLRNAVQKYRTWLMLIAMILIVLIGISATFGKNHVNRIIYSIGHAKEELTRSRLYIWDPAVQIIHDYPVIGTGLDTFKTVFPRYAPKEFAQVDGANVSSRTAHNEILQVLACQGIIGLLIVTWLTVLILVNWRKAYLKAKDNWRDRLILTGLLASWSAYSIQNVFSFGVVAIDSFYWLIIGLSVLMQHTDDEHTAPSRLPAKEPRGLFKFISSVKPLAMIAVIIVSGITVYLSLSIALADFNYNLGTLYRLQGRRDLCLNYFKKATFMVPTEVKYRVYYGLAHEEIAKAAPSVDQKMEWIEKAIKYYRQGQAMNPTNAYYLGNLGRAYGFASTLDMSNTGYYEKSVHYFKEAINYAPVTVLFYVNLAMTYLGRKDEEAFVEIIDQLAKIDVKEAATVTFTAANQLYNFGLLNDAKKYYEKSVELNPDYTDAMFNLGVTMARLNNPDGAVAMWERLLKVKSDFKPALQMLERYKGNRKNIRPSSVIIK